MLIIAAVTVACILLDNVVWKELFKPGDGLEEFRRLTIKPNVSI
jgi:hypothetical protein